MPARQVSRRKSFEIVRNQVGKLELTYVYENSTSLKVLESYRKKNLIAQ